MSLEDSYREYEIPKYKIIQHDDDCFEIKIQYYPAGNWHYVEFFTSLEDAREARDSFIETDTHKAEKERLKKAKGYPKEVK